MIALVPGTSACEACELVKALRSYIAAIRMEAMRLRMEVAALEDAAGNPQAYANVSLPDLFTTEPKGSAP